MKPYALLPVLAAGSLLAGEKTPILEKSPIVAPASPDLYSWFAGGTVGYLNENETELYTGHLGVDLPHKLGSWDQALYLEIGYAELDHREYSSVSAITGTDGGMGELIDIIIPPREYYPYGKGGGPNPLMSALFGSGYLDMDLEIVPITLNYKLEKELTPSLNVYCGLGAGVALFEADVESGFTDDDDDDTVFFAQAFGGILKNVTPSFELFAGARVIYFDEPEFDLFGGDVDLSDFRDVGLDVENTDVVVEVGGRLNF